MWKWLVVLLLVGCSSPTQGDASITFIAQPTTTVAGQPMPAVGVRGTDEGGAPLVGDVRVELASPTDDAGTLVGTLTLPFVDGEATFEGLVVTYPSDGRQLLATSSGITATSTLFDVTVGPPSTLEVTPETGLADATLAFTVTTTLLAGDRPIANYPVAVSASGTGNVFSAASGVTDADGRFSTTFGSSVFGPKTIIATAGSFTLTRDIVLSSLPCTPQLPGAPSKVHGRRTQQLLVEDFDNDGQLDVAAAENTSIAIIRKVGTNSQSAPVRYSVPTDAEGIASGDLDGDGDIDIVAASDDGASVNVLLNTGNATFAAGIQVFDMRAKAVALGLFTADAVLDLAVRTPTQIYFFEGLGNGMFQPVLTPITLGAAHASATKASLVFADLTGDTRLDLVIADDRSISTSVGSAVGFGASVGITIAPSFSNPVVGDFDEDTKLDLVVGAQFAKGLGTGNFASPVSLNVSEPTAATAVDFDEDGHLDLAMMISNFVGAPMLLRMFEGNGAGGFSEETQRYAVLSGEALVAKDLDGDTHSDLVIGSGVTQIQAYRGTGTSILAPRYDGEDGRFSPIAADFDGNGTPDLVAHTFLSGLLQIRTVGPAGVQPAGIVPNSSVSSPLVAGDFDGDMKADLLVGGPQSVRWFRGNGDATVQADVASAIGFPEASSAAVAVAATLDGNATLDVALVDGFDRKIGIVLGTGTGSFTLGPVIQLVDQPTNVFAHDLDDDADIDLVVTTRISATVHPALVVLRNDGGSFTQVPSPLMGGAFHVTVGDFNADGKADLVVPHDTGSVSFLAGNGDATFDLDVRSTAGVPLQWTDATDVDGDGILDVIGLGSGVVFLRGKGDGTFAPPLIYPSEGTLALGGDFNQDARRDVLILSVERGVTLVSNRACE